MRTHPVPTANAAAPPQPPLLTFLTQNTNFAAYLAATNRLRYCGARPATAGRNGVEFLFDDPTGKGLPLLRAFKSGNALPAEPRALFEAQGFLKSEVKRVLRAAEGVGNVQPSR